MKAKNWALLVSVSVVLVLGGCGKAEESPQASPGAVTAAPQMKLPAHNYSVKDGSEYGYQSKLTEEDVRQGKAAISLRMFSYLGERDGLHQVMLREGNVRLIAECANPCVHARVYRFIDGDFIDREIYAMNPSMLLSQVFDDALAGQLEQLQGMRDGRLVSFWVDTAEKRVVHYPVESPPKQPS